MGKVISLRGAAFDESHAWLHQVDRDKGFHLQENPGRVPYLVRVRSQKGAKLVYLEEHLYRVCQSLEAQNGAEMAWQLVAVLALHKVTRDQVATDNQWLDAIGETLGDAAVVRFLTTWVEVGEQKVTENELRLAALEEGKKMIASRLSELDAEAKATNAI